MSELVHQTFEGALIPRMDSRLMGGGVVKHRSPLVTLATVFVAFAIMFTVNMLSGQPGKSSAGTADAPVGSASRSASSESPQPIETAVVSPFTSANVSNTKDGSAAIAEAVLGNQAAAHGARQQPGRRDR